MTQQGGAREGSGRYVINSKLKKKQTYVYVELYILEKLGGKQNVQKIMREAVDKAYQDKLAETL